MPLSLIIFGIVDYGWAFLQASVVANAAREGARAGVVGGDTAAAELAAEDALTAGGLDPGVATITVTTAGDDLSVDVVYLFTPIVGFVPTPSELQNQVTMRLENGT